MYKSLDAELVRFVLDCGHAFRAKVDVAAFFARHHERIDGLHLRDFNPVHLAKAAYWHKKRMRFDDGGKKIIEEVTREEDRG